MKVNFKRKQLLLAKEVVVVKVKEYPSLNLLYFKGYHIDAY